MPDVYRKLGAGSKVTDFSLTVYNKTIDMLQWWQNTQQRSGSGSLRNLIDWDQSVFRLKNNTGYDLVSYDPVGLDGPIFDPIDDAATAELTNQTSQKGVEPAVADHAGGKWGVMLEATPDGKIGRCCIAGVVPVRVYVGAAPLTHADVITMETVNGEDCYLGTGGSGAQILWLEDDTADTIVWAIVRLGSGGNAWYQLIRDLDDDDYEGLANPATIDPDTGILSVADEYFDPVTGAPITGPGTVIVLDPAGQQPAWAGDFFIGEPFTPAVTYADPKSYKLAPYNVTKYALIVRRASQQLSFWGTNTTSLGHAGTCTLQLLMNSSGPTTKAGYDAGYVPSGKTLPANEVVQAVYSPNARKFYVVPPPCLPAS